MKYGTVTREQAIAVFGEELVNRLDSENCDFTNRVQTDGDTTIEFSATLRGLAADDGQERTLTAYYYQDADMVREAEDLGSLDWVIDGYEII